MWIEGENFPSSNAPGRRWAKGLSCRTPKTLKRQQQQCQSKDNKTGGCLLSLKTTLTIQIYKTVNQLNYKTEETLHTLYMILKANQGKVINVN